MAARTQTAGVLITIWFLPLFWSFVAAFLCDGTAGRLLSSTPSLANFELLFTRSFETAIVGSVIVAVASATLSVVIALGMASWCIGNDGRLGIVLGPALTLRCVPPIALLLAHLAALSILELSKSRTLLILFHAVAALPIALVVIVPRLRSLDTGRGGATGLGDIAAVDGLPQDVYLFYVLVPAMLPDLLLAWALCFAFSWGEFLYAGVLLPSPDVWTLPVLMSTFEGSQRIDWGPLYASITVSVTVLLGAGALLGKLVRNSPAAQSLFGSRSG